MRIIMILRSSRRIRLKSYCVLCIRRENNCLSKKLGTISKMSSTRKLGESSSNRTRRFGDFSSHTHSFICSSLLKEKLSLYTVCAQWKSINIWFYKRDWRFAVDGSWFTFEHIVRRLTDVIDPIRLEISRFLTSTYASSKLGIFSISIKHEWPVSSRSSSCKYFKEGVLITNSSKRSRLSLGL